MRSILIFGGSFDPIHRGHLELLAAAIKELRPARVLLLPDLHPPHKKAPVAPLWHRIRMIRMGNRAKLSASQRKRCRIHLHPIKSSKKHYTIRTLQALKKQMPRASFFLLLGSDAFRQFKTWKNWKQILKDSTLLVGHRKGSPLGRVSTDILAHSRWLRGRFPSISSSEIRRRLRCGENPGALLPSQLDYIQENNLYGFQEARIRR